MSTLKHPCRYRQVIEKIRDFLWCDWGTGKLTPSKPVEAPAILTEIVGHLDKMGLYPTTVEKRRPLRDSSCRPKVLVRVKNGVVTYEADGGVEVAVVYHDAGEAVPAAYQHLVKENP